MKFDLHQAVTFSDSLTLPHTQSSNLNTLTSNLSPLTPHTLTSSPYHQFTQDVLRVRILIQQEENIPRIDIDRAIERLLIEIITHNSFPVSVECDPDQLSPAVYD